MRANKELADNIRNLRKSKGYKQVDVAEKMEITRVSYVNIENCRQHVTIDNLQKICNIFKVKSSEILPF